MSQETFFNLVNDFVRYFNSIVLEALPFVVLGVIIAGVLEEFVPQAFLRNLFGGPSPIGEARPPAPGLLGLVRRLVRFRLAAVAVGALLGLIFPMCECGIIAIMRRLIRKGVPLSVCVSYMLAGPIINVVVLLSTFVAFNPQSSEEYLFNVFVFGHDIRGPLNITLLRGGLAFLIACTTALVVNWQYRRHGTALLHPRLVMPAAEEDDDATNNQPRPIGERLQSIAETALHDFIDIMTFLVLGAALATVGRMSLENEQVMETTRRWIAEGPPALAILLMMGLAVLFCLCSEADAFVAANFPRLWPPASKLAFLVLGPMFDLKLLAMYTRIFRARLIWTIVVAVVIQVFLHMLAVHYIWPGHGYSESFILRGR